MYSLPKKNLYFQEADKRAEALDAAGSDPEYKKPQLFGLPISIKSCIAVQGHDLFSGYADNLEKPQAEDSLLVQELQELGSIPFVTTTVPLSLLTFSCENPVYGTTKHPERADRTCGGSSGGEAALIAAKGSIIGIGSDVGGSIRIPSAFCGIAGIKPSHRRFSKFSSPGSVPGRSHTYASIGPMATNIKDCARLLQAVWSNDWFHKHDPYVPPINFNNEMYLSKKPLKIGYYVDDGWFKATPAVERAVLETVESLRQLGHTVVEWKPHDIYKALQLVFKATTFDNGKYLHDAILKDLPVDGYGPMVRQSSLPVWFRKSVSFLLGNISPRLANVAGACHTDLSDLRQTNCGVEQYQKEFAQRWINNGLDCLLCPINVCPAMRHKEPYKLFSTVSYTILYNGLDYAGGTVPVTRVTQQDCDKLKDYPTTDSWYKAARNSAADTVGLPVGIQIVVPPYKEECALRVLGEIEEKVKENGTFVR
uniref:fatty acid amide hydrolase n=1 Tax=Bursaphelenchus xylophilus TaxID=6326 RepID=A0A1I7RN43_BURXY